MQFYAHHLLKLKQKVLFTNSMKCSDQSPIICIIYLTSINKGINVLFGVADV